MPDEFRKVRITSDGFGAGTVVADAATGEPIPECYAFEVRGSRTSAVTKAAIYCYAAKADITTDAAVVTIPRQLKARAEAIAAQMDSDLVRTAFRDLLGCACLPPPEPDEPDPTETILRDLERQAARPEV